jgi:predicted DNA-binding transcriptional regulator AlpA
MKALSTNQVAKKVGIATKTLSRYVAQGKIPAPRIIEVGGSTIHSWTEPEVERLRMLLPKIANGRKTRHKKKQSGSSSQQKK